MKNQNLTFSFIHSSKFVCLLCAVLLAIGCSLSPKINETAKQEAETIANDASRIYQKAQEIVSMEIEYGWSLILEVNDTKTRNEKFISAAKELETARDKFLQASAKMNEALNGQKKYDNEQATRLSRMSEAYKRFSERAEFERKTWQEASTLTDPKLLRQKLTEAQKIQNKMTKDLMSFMRGIG